MQSRPELTERQAQVLAFIEERICEWGYPPTIREIGEHLGIRSTNGVADHLKALKRKGYLTQRDLKSRTLAPVASPSAGNGRDSTVVSTLVGRGGRGVAIPILGRVAAGEPILAEEHAEGSVVVDAMLLGDGRRVFALKVVGESMIDAGIFDGDFIFVRKRESAEPGDIVVVMIEGESTVKRFYPEGERIRLQPANSRMQPIYVHRRDFKNVQIIGTVVGVYRKM
jgi:repressor LexA